ncbi:MAG: RsmD family RNA methyltransferase [Victivallales bacterium]
MLSKLRLHGGVMWDVGAGSGSVGLEAAGLCASVYAVEKNAERAERIRRNAERESPAEFHLCEGTFSDLEKELPIRISCSSEEARNWKTF